MQSILNSIFNNAINLDAPMPWGIYFQDSATPQMEGLIELHDNIMFYLVLILFSVGWILFSIVKNFINTKALMSHKYLNHGKNVPIQKCFKFNNIYIVSKPYIRFYSTSPNSPSNDIPFSIKLYEDAYLMRKSIIKENKGKSGIYMWTNKITGDIYIGQSVDLADRLKRYFHENY